VFIIYWYLY